MSFYNLLRPLRRAGFFPRLCNHTFVLPGIDDTNYITIEKYSGNKALQRALTRLTEVNTDSSLLARVVKTYIADPSIGIYYHDDKYVVTDIKNKTLRSAGYIQVHEFDENIQEGVDPKYASLHARIAEVTGAIYRIPALYRTMIRPGATSITFQSNSVYCNSWLGDLQFKLVPEDPKGDLDKYLEEVKNLYYAGIDYEVVERLRTLKFRIFKDVRTPNRFILKDIRTDTWYSFTGNIGRDVIEKYHNLFKRRFEMMGVRLIGGGTIELNRFRVQSILKPARPLDLNEYTVKDLGIFIYAFINAMTAILNLPVIDLRITRSQNVVILFRNEYGTKQIGYMIMPYPTRPHTDQPILNHLVDLN